MNRLNKLLCGIALIGLATGCSNEDIPNTGSVDKAGDVYARLSLSLPSTRSETTDDGNSDAGFEIGKDYENTVSSVLVVLSSKEESDYKYVAASLADATAENNDANLNPMYSVSFKSEEISEFAGKEVYVFALCNPSINLINQVKNLGATGEKGKLNDLMGNIIDDGSISVKENFLMANHSLSSVLIPSMEDLLNKYNSSANPFNLGTVDVSRVTARFDFKQTTYQGMTTPNRYPIYDTYTITTDTPNGTDENGNPVYETTTTIGQTLLGYVTIDGMALMNEALDYYCLPRVSANGMEEAASLCGAETNSNFVVSPNASYKTENPLTLDFMRNNYRYNGIPADATTVEPYSYDTFTFEDFSNLTEEDNDANWNADNKVGYKIWKYVTENTIPGKDLDGINNTIDYQRLGVTTCIVFRAFIEPDAQSEIASQFNGTDYIYCYNGKLIGNMTTLKQKVKESPISSLADAFYAAAKANDQPMDADGTINPDNVTLNDFQKTATTERGEGLKIFKPENEKYYCYYIYRNRHNDNARTDLMGPMEFAVVRNNIYKIDVQSILEFGHTKHSTDDPDPEDPETPDEPNKAYFRLNVRVLPWVVRVNHAIL